MLFDFVNFHCNGQTGHTEKSDNLVCCLLVILFAIFAKTPQWRCERLWGTWCTDCLPDFAIVLLTLTLLLTLPSRFLKTCRVFRETAKIWDTLFLPHIEICLLSDKLLSLVNTDEYSQYASIMQNQNYINKYYKKQTEIHDYKYKEIERVTKN